MRASNMGLANPGFEDGQVGEIAKVQDSPGKVLAQAGFNELLVSADRHPALYLGIEEGLEDSLQLLVELEMERNGRPDIRRARHCRPREGEGRQRIAGRRFELREW